MKIAPPEAGASYTNTGLIGWNGLVQLCFLLLLLGDGEKRDRWRILDIF